MARRVNFLFSIFMDRVEFGCAQRPCGAVATALALGSPGRRSDNRDSYPYMAPESARFTLERFSYQLVKMPPTRRTKASWRGSSCAGQLKGLRRDLSINAYSPA
jgi:hypothetical protein